MQRIASTRPRSGSPFMATIAILSLLLMSASAQAAAVRPGWLANGPVKATAYSNNTIYLGGQFTALGQLQNVTGAGASISYATGAPDQPFSDVQGTVRAVETDGQGGWYIGGSFTSVQGQPRSNLAHIDSFGSLTSWAPSP